MTLPSSGEMSAAMINAELGTSGDLGFGDPNPRALAGIPSGDIRASDFYGKTNPNAARVYVDVSALTMAGAGDIVQFQSIVGVTLPYRFSLTANADEYMYWVSPVSMGYVEFYDMDSMFIGGWDGAHNDLNILGPRVVTIDGANYYLYRTDFPGLGLGNWEARVGP